MLMLPMHVGRPHVVVPLLHMLADDKDRDDKEVVSISVADDRKRKLEKNHQSKSSNYINESCPTQNQSPIIKKKTME